MIECWERCESHGQLALALVVVTLIVRPGRAPRPIGAPASRPASPQPDTPAGNIKITSSGAIPETIT